MTRKKFIKILDESPFTKCSDDKYCYNGSTILLIDTMVVMYLYNNGSEIGVSVLEYKKLSKEFRITKLKHLPIVEVRFNLSLSIYIR